MYDQPATLDGKPFDSQHQFPDQGITAFLIQISLSGRVTLYQQRSGSQGDNHSVRLTRYTVASWFLSLSSGRDIFKASVDTVLHNQNRFAEAYTLLSFVDMGNAKSEQGGSEA